GKNSHVLHVAVCSHGTVAERVASNRKGHNGKSYTLHSGRSPTTDCAWPRRRSLQGTRRTRNRTQCRKVGSFGHHLPAECKRAQRTHPVCASGLIHSIPGSGSIGKLRGSRRGS